MTIPFAIPPLQTAARARDTRMHMYILRVLTGSPLVDWLAAVLYMSVQQSGAVEACWAHNPEVCRSKLCSVNDKLFYFKHYLLCHSGAMPMSSERATTAQ